MAAPKLPEKTREMHNHHFDSTIWNDFTFRDDDIVIATYAKSVHLLRSEQSSRNTVKTCSDLRVNRVLCGMRRPPAVLNEAWC